jgi:transcriptional regulator with XRE-family HTH domain
VSTEYQEALGRKIAQHRRRRGLSQPELAKRIDRSVAWVSQVERGVRKVDRMSVLETVAQALDVPLGELAAEAPVVAAAADERPESADLRIVLAGAHALRAMLGDQRKLDAAALREQVGRAWQLTHAGSYTELTELLRKLIPQLETSARAVPPAESAGLFELLSTAYQACSAALAKLDDPDAAWIAAERSMAAAERAGDPLFVAAGAFRLGFVFLSAKHFDQAEETARTASEALRVLADEGRPEAMSLWGSLTLQRAVAASRTNNDEVAYAHIEDAREIAGRLGDGRNDYNTEFGPANVDLYEIAVAVELGDAGRALRAAERVDVSGLSPERQGRMLIDVARAHAQRRQVDDAVAALRRGEEITPEQVRAHTLVRQLVSDLLTMQDPASEELRDLAQKVGV